MAVGAFSGAFSPAFAVDSAPPVTTAITVVAPAAGQALVRSTVIELDVTSVVLIKRIIIYIDFTKPNLWEVAFDSEQWGPSYTPGSANVMLSISGGFRFRILRDGGWQQTPRVRVIAIDADGNVVTI